MTRIIAVGDSIANADLSLAFWMSEATGADLSRVSRGGATADAVVGQLEQIEGRYDVAVLTVGTNDVLGGTAAESFRASLSTIFADLHERAVQVVMPTIHPTLAGFPGSRRTLAARVEAINAVLRERDDAVLVDGDVELSVDRVHPTTRGQRDLAARALVALGLPDSLPGDEARERASATTLRTAGVMAAKSLLRRY